MLNTLQKMILSLLLMGSVMLTPVSAESDQSLTDAQLNAFLGIITSFILENRSDLPDTPTLVGAIPTTTNDSNITIQIHAEVNSTVFLNGTEVGTVDENGTVMLTLALTHGVNEFRVTVKDETGNESFALVLTITMIPKLLINEISSAYYTNDDRWFEIYNPTTVDIDISDYTLKSRAYSGSGTINNSFEFSFPSKIIPAGKYLVIRPNYGPAYNTVLPNIENEQVLYLKDTTSKKYPLWFSDTKGFLEILKNGKTIDFVSIGNAYTPTTSAEWIGAYVPSFTSSGSEFWKSIARDINSTDTNTFSDWQVKDFPTYAALNDVTCNDDVDQDGIPDCSEVNGSTYAGMDLYAFGARTNQKDIFIEVDYMDSTNSGALAVDVGVVPQKEALQKVQASFLANAYVVHFDVGDLYAQDGNVTNPAQMDLGGGNEVNYALSVSLDATNTADNVRNYKVNNMHVERKTIFYYMLFGTSQKLDGTDGSSGLAEKPGNDSLMTLGGWGLHKGTVAATNALINFQAGTVMHEFGHNLNLAHGGNEDENYKPNYVSIMNYLYQLDGLSTIGDNEGDRYYRNKGAAGCPNTPLTNPYNGDPQNFIIDYSHGIASNLEEVTGIDEGNGLGYPGSVPVDYNCNSSLADTLTNFNVNPDFNIIKNTVTDHNDWDAINIIFARTNSGNSGVSRNVSDNNRISINPLVNDIQPVAEEKPIKIPSH